MVKLKYSYNQLTSEMTVDYNIILSLSHFHSFTYLSLSLPLSSSLSLFLPFWFPQYGVITKLYSGGCININCLKERFLYVKTCLRLFVSIVLDSHTSVKLISQFRYVNFLCSHIKYAYQTKEIVLDCLCQLCSILIHQLN